MIEKSNIQFSSQDDFLTGIYDWLKANAEGFVFDEVSIDDYLTISCRKDGAEVVTLNKFGDNGFGKVALGNGKDIYLYGILSSFNANDVPFVNAYKTMNGIALEIRQDRGASIAQATLSLFVTSDGLIGCTPCHRNGSSGEPIVYTGELIAPDFTYYGDGLSISADQIALTPVIGLNTNKGPSKSLFISLFSTEKIGSGVKYISDGSAFYVYDGCLALKD